MFGSVPQLVAEHAAAFFVGAVVGVWVGGRFLVIRKRRDEP